MLKTASVKTPRKAAIGRLLGNVLYPVCAFAFVIAVWAIVAAVKICQYCSRPWERYSARSATFCPTAKAGGRRV